MSVAEHTEQSRRNTKKKNYLSEYNEDDISRGYPELITSHLGTSDDKLKAKLEPIKIQVKIVSMTDLHSLVELL